MEFPKIAFINSLASRNVCYALVMNGNTFCKGHIYESKFVFITHYCCFLNCFYDQILSSDIYIFCFVLRWYFLSQLLEEMKPKMLQQTRTTATTATTHTPQLPTVKHIIDMIQFWGKDGVTVFSFVSFLVDFKNVF